METIDVYADRVADAAADLVSSVHSGQSAREFIGSIDRVADEQLQVFTQLAQQLITLLDIDGVGAILGGPESANLRRAGEVPTELAVVQQAQTTRRQGPALDCLSVGSTVHAPGPESVRQRWPALADLAGQVGIAAMFAIPVRAHGHQLGSVTLVRTRAGSLEHRGIRTAQMLADTAAFVALRDFSLGLADIRVRQLQTALDSRVRIEQAKGVLAARLDTTPDLAFAVLRSTARNLNRKLTDVAGDVVTGLLAERP